jgi:hypothetical protein
LHTETAKRFISEEFSTDICLKRVIIYVEVQFLTRSKGGKGINFLATAYTL